MLIKWNDGVVGIELNLYDMHPVAAQTIYREMVYWAMDNNIEYDTSFHRQSDNLPSWIYFLEQDMVAFKLRFGL